MDDENPRMAKTRNKRSAKPEKPPDTADPLAAIVEHLGQAGRILQRLVAQQRTLCRAKAYAKALTEISWAAEAVIELTPTTG